MSNFWDERYNTEEYVYGEAPNEFLQKKLAHLKPGKILFPAEGEGRNAVYAAKLGWDVSAFDISVEGQNKALNLAAKKGVSIKYEILGFENANFEPVSFDCICLVFAHMPSEVRRNMHKKLISFLKPGGLLILEAFSKKQLGKNSGGPSNLDLLFSEQELKEDFYELNEINFEETETILNEGPFHQGTASLIRVIGKK